MTCAQELRERLWDISDKRKEQDEQERTSVMTNGWLEEHSVILVNHHSILTQVNSPFLCAVYLESIQTPFTSFTCCCFRQPYAKMY